MGDGDQSDVPADIDERLRKIPSMKKALKEDVAATQQSVEDKVRELRVKIDRRNSEIEIESHRLRGAMATNETLKRQHRENKDRIYAIISEKKRLRVQNEYDEAQIKKIKASHKDAENRLRRVEEGINSLGTMFPKPAAEARGEAKRLEIDSSSDELLSPRKRQRTGPAPASDPLGPRDTTTWKEVYDGGKTMQEIIKCPKTGQYFILACSTHGIKFGTSAIRKATAHARCKDHDLKLTQQEVIDIFGVLVLDCRQWHFGRNNGACRTNHAKAKDQAKKDRPGQVIGRKNGISLPFLG